MTKPFISSVFDNVEPQSLSVEAGSRILADAMGPELGLQSPHNLTAQVLAFFRVVLSDYRSGARSRKDAEAAVTKIFSLAARRDYAAMMDLAVGKA